MRLLVLIISVHKNVDYTLLKSGCPQMRSVLNVCDQSRGGERVWTQQHGQRVVTMASRVSFKNNLNTKRMDQHTTSEQQRELPLQYKGKNQNGVIWTLKCQ